MNWVDAIKEGDCLCVTLDIGRSQAAIADPSQVVIKAVHQTLITAESFLDSVEFGLSKAENAEDIHGGFDKRNQGSVVVGASREVINGALPLFIHKDHWSIAKHKIRPILGWTATLDSLGYTYSQLETIPFLVLARASQDLSTQHKRTQFQLLLQTCTQIYRDASSAQDNKDNKESSEKKEEKKEENKDNKADDKENKEIRFTRLSDKIAYQFEHYMKEATSRTVDVIVNNQLFLAHLLCAINTGDISPLTPEVSAQLLIYIVEEELRRSQPRTYSELSETDLTNIIRAVLGIEENIHVTPYLTNFRRYLDQKQQTEGGGQVSSYELAFRELAKKSGKTTSSQSQRSADQDNKQNRKNKDKKERKEDKQERKEDAKDVEFEGPAIPPLNRVLSAAGSAMLIKFTETFQRHVAPLFEMRLLLHSKQTSAPTSEQTKQTPAKTGTAPTSEQTKQTTGTKEGQKKKKKKKGKQAKSSNNSDDNKVNDSKSNNQQEVKEESGKAFDILNVIRKAFSDERTKLDFQRSSSIVWMLIQNIQHPSNAKRRFAISNNTYREPFCGEDGFGGSLIVESEYKRLVNEWRQQAHTNELTLRTLTKSANIAGIFGASSSIHECAGILLNVYQGTNIRFFVEKLQSDDCPLAVEKIRMLVTGELDGVPLICDRLTEGERKFREERRVDKPKLESTTDGSGSGSKPNSKVEKKDQVAKQKRREQSHAERAKWLAIPKDQRPRQPALWRPSKENVYRFLKQNRSKATLKQWLLLFPHQAEYVNFMLTHVHLFSPKPKGTGIGTQIKKAKNKKT